MTVVGWVLMTGIYPVVLMSVSSFVGADFLLLLRMQGCGLVCQRRTPAYVRASLPRAVYSCPVCAGDALGGLGLLASWRSFRFGGDYGACRVMKDGAAGTCSSNSFVDFLVPLHDHQCDHWRNDCKILF